MSEKFPRAEFQKKDLEFLTKLDSSANWGSMGTYKTSTAQFLAKDIGAQRILVITSKTGFVTYYQTVPHILPHLQQYTISSKDLPVQLGYVGKRRQRANGLFLVNYDLFTTKSPVSKALRSTDFDLIIMDESHKIKSHKSQRSRQIHYLKADVKHCMTGSPFVNNPSDLWSQVRAIAPKDKLGGYWSFANQFCEWDEQLLQRGFRKCVGIKNRKQLKSWLDSFSVRHTLEEIMPELPGKVYHQRDVILNFIQRRMYNEIKSDLFALDQAGIPLHAPNVLAGLSRLRQITSATPKVNSRTYNPDTESFQYDISLTEPSSKLDAVMDVLSETDSQVVIFYTHKDVGKLLNERLIRAGVSCINMLARHTDRERFSMVEAFQSGKAKVFHSTLALGSESITLTAADTVLFVDRAWTPKDNDQAEDRVRRPGQTRPVNVVDIYARGTTDGYVRTKVDTKRGWFNQVFDNEYDGSVWDGND